LTVDAALVLKRQIYMIDSISSVPLVTVRVDEETKKRMESLERINWSRVLREKIAEVLERETRRNRMEALRSMDRLRRKSPPGWDSTRFIRQTRETRYGPRRDGR